VQQEQPVGAGRRGDVGGDLDTSRPLRQDRRSADAREAKWETTRCDDG
jgi:hypothetical protein